MSKSWWWLFNESFKSIKLRAQVLFSGAYECCSTVQGSIRNYTKTAINHENSRSPGSPGRADPTRERGDVLCVHWDSTAGLSERRKVGGASNWWLFKSHLSRYDDSIKPPPIDINHVPPQTHSFISQYVAVTVTHCLLFLWLYTHSSILLPRASERTNRHWSFWLKDLFRPFTKFPHSIFVFKMLILFPPQQIETFMSQQLHSFGSWSLLSEEHETGLSADICWLLGKQNCNLMRADCISLCWCENGSKLR